MEIQVKFKRVLTKDEGMSKNGEPWTSVLFLGETDERYSKNIAFKIFNKKNLVEKVFSLQEDSVITVRFDVESREYNGRFYTDILVWAILSGSDGTSPENNTNTQESKESAPEEAKTAPQNNVQAPVQEQSQEEGDPLPF